MDVRKKGREMGKTPSTGHKTGYSGPRPKSHKPENSKQVHRHTGHAVEQSVGDCAYLTWEDGTYQSCLEYHTYIMNEPCGWTCSSIAIRANTGSMPDRAV